MILLHKSKQVMLVVIFTFSLLCSSLYAQKNSTIKSSQFLSKIANKGFEENKGQINGEDAKEVKFLYKANDVSVFLLSTGIAYQFTKTHYPEGYKTPSKSNTPEENEKSEALEKDIRLETYRMDVLLKGTNPSPKITTNGKSLDYTQYYNRNTLNVHNYNKVTYHNVYPNIDWVVYSKQGNLKYDFIVHPGGNPKQIKLKTNWVEELKLNAAGDLILKNRMGQITEEHPVSFQGNEKIKTSFILNNQEISFDVQNYDSSKDLIIDPIVRMWGTYLGGSGFDQINDCATDPSGNVFIAGRTSSTFAIASGGHDNSYGGGSSDAFLVKFNASGVRQWGTYYGGTASDFAYGCATDASGNSYICGPTYSTSGIASGGYDNSHAGNNDAFLVKFNAAGVRQWATYHGGSSFDNGDACAVDASGNIYMTGGTESNGLATSGVHRTSRGGNSDAYLSKFNSSGARIWCTYYGGSNTERYVYGCATDPSGNPYIAGRTESSNNIASGGAHDGSYGGSGNDDAFLAKFNTSNGQRLWGTYYGTATFDWGTDCTTDASGNVYLVGGTSSTSSIASGGHQNTSGGSTEGFLVKFNSSGTRQWGTYYGGSGSDVFEGCVTDASGNIYAAGWTSSTTNIASNGYQNTIGGASDGLLVKFNSAGVRQWGTYYGGSSNERDGNCAVDGSGNIFLAGSTVSTNNMASTGAHDVSFGGGTDDGYLVKFSDCVPETNTTSTASICENQTKTLTSSGAGAGTWSIVSGGGSISGSTYTPANVTNNTNVTVRYTDACGTATNRIFTVNVRNIANNTTSTATICENQTKSLVGSPSGGTWSVVSGGGTITGTTYTPSNISSNTTVTVRYTIATNGGCPATTSNRSFTVNPIITPSITSSNALMCVSDTRTLTGTPTGGSWSVVSGPGSISGTTLTSNATGTIQLRYRIVNACGNNDATQSITVSNAATATITSSSSSLCQNLTRTLTGTPASGTWRVLSGNATISAGTLTPNGTGLTRIEYEVTSSCGNGRDTMDIIINPIPTAEAGANESICLGDSVTLTATGGVTYSWAPGGSSMASQSFSPTSNTTYIVTVANDSGCISIDSATISIQSPSNASAIDDELTVIRGEESSINIYNNDTGEINSIIILNGASNGTSTINNGVLSYQSDDNYIGADSILYEICDANCQSVCDTAWVRILVETNLFIPQFISPNQDGINDYWFIDGLQRYTNTSVKIFNRWGTLIFESSPYNNDWNGKENNTTSGGKTSGTYFYILELGDGSEAKTGYIQIRK